MALLRAGLSRTLTPTLAIALTRTRTRTLTSNPGEHILSPPSR